MTVERVLQNQNSKTNDHNLILLRGLPGSGKSTLARILSERGKYPVHSVDAYFTDDLTGEYSFHFEKNHLAYKDCCTKTEASMQRSESKIFVDNTFVFDWEVAPYLALSKKYHYKIFVVTTEKYHTNANVHGITDDQILKMAARYKVKLTV